MIIGAVPLGGVIEFLVGYKPETLLIPLKMFMQDLD